MISSTPSYMYLSPLYLLLFFLTPIESVFINQINKTHFSCDNEQNIFPMIKFNDDYCDCIDGSDENRTNACPNGEFYCANRFYEPVSISTSKVNDGICDCCDGTDEFNLGCPKTCIDLSSKQYELSMDTFLNLKRIVMNYPEEQYLSYFEYNKNLIEKIISTFHDLNDLMEKRFLLKSYLSKIENSLTEENENYFDDEGVSYKDLKILVNNLNDRIQLYEDFLKSQETIFNGFQKFSIFRDLFNEEVHKVNYKYFECELLPYKSFRCSGYKGNKYRQKNLGDFVEFKDNKLSFKNGSKCFYYNKLFSANINIECGSVESITFKEKIDGCHYEFIFTTPIGCNSLKLKSLQDKIKLYLNDINL